METKQYKQGEVIFAENMLGNTMYEISSGNVAIYAAYGKPEQKKLTELGPGRIFGEMGVIEVFPRSATAVAESAAEVKEISTEDLSAYFNHDPQKLCDIMHSMTRRLRELTKDYDEACAALDEWRETTKAGQKKRTGLMALLEKFARVYSESSYNEH